MTVVDASVWVSSLVIQDVHHVASHRWLRQQIAADGLLVGPTLVLAEVAGAISRRTGTRDRGRQAAAEILRAPGLRLVALDIEMAREAARLAAGYQLRGADVVYVAVAYTLNVPLITWNEELQARVGQLIAIVQP